MLDALFCGGKFACELVTSFSVLHRVEDENNVELPISDVEEAHCLSGFSDVGQYDL